MPETAYSKRREHSAIITYACDNVMKTCFCTSTGGSPVEKTGDIWMMKLEDGYLVESLTPRGEELLALGEGLFVDATTDDQTKAKDIGDRVTTSMEVMQVSSAAALDKLFKDEAFWKELTEKCLSCGACTFVCPTCYCFDVRDEGSVASGDRYRRWDSCMFFQYNRAAGGHNPRDMHWKRMRQRMLHKFCYFVENYGDIDCVGCGRCVRSCPVSYDIRDFIKKSFDATRGYAEAVVSAAPVSVESPVKDEIVTSDNDKNIDANIDLKSPGVTNEITSTEDTEGVEETPADEISGETGFAAALPSENDEPFVCEAKIGIFDSNKTEDVMASDNAIAEQDSNRESMIPEDSDTAGIVDSSEEAAVDDTSSADAPDEVIPEEAEEVVEDIVEVEEAATDNEGADDDMSASESGDNNVSSGMVTDSDDETETTVKNPGLGTSSIGAGVAVNVFQWPPKETVSIFSSNDDADEDDAVEDMPGNGSGQKTNENNVTGEGSDV
jgi:ferredoxin